MNHWIGALACVTALTSATTAHASTVVLYDQDFENPASYENDGGDLDIDSDAVNQNYGGQPPGFQFAQAFTVEVLNVSGSERGGGTAAHGTGWSDPTGIGENFAIGMLSSAQNDLLGLSFNVGDADFFNLSIDISSVDLSTFGAPFVPVGGSVPTFQFTLFDNPSGNRTTGSGTVLDQATVSGVASEREVFDWRNFVIPLSTTGNTNGNVTLRIDLLSGGYAAFDNLLIAASDTAGDVGDPIPLPAAAWMFLAGAAVLGRKLKR